MGSFFVLSWLQEHAFIFSWLFSAALWLIPVLAITAAFVYGYERLNFIDILYDKLVWYGAMRCASCFYQWQSRKNTPPAKCPKCGTKNIHTVELKEKAVHRLKKKSLTAEDWAEIRKMEVQSFVPGWFVLIALLFVVELVYLATSYSS
jgi:predicted RNA-binding Zn-ribbon protein involved in translation (DUF1610 family)